MFYSPLHHTLIHGNRRKLLQSQIDLSRRIRDTIARKRAQKDFSTWLRELCRYCEINDSVYGSKHRCYNCRQNLVQLGIMEPFNWVIGNVAHTEHSHYSTVNRTQELLVSWIFSTRPRTSNSSQPQYIDTTTITAIAAGTMVTNTILQEMLDIRSPPLWYSTEITGIKIVYTDQPTQQPAP